MEAVNKKCVECGKDFELPSAERNFFSLKGLPEPKRCKPCRAKRKMLNGGMAHPMGGEHGANRE